MPFDKADVALLEVLKNEFIASIKTCVNTQGHIDVHQAAIAFEKANQQKVIFEKLGIEKRVQVMTIHKSKGREFDGVVLVLEDSRKAIWRREGRATEEEIEDLYRVALSRAKSMFALVAFEDAWRDAAAPVTRLLPRPSFYARVAGKTGASP
jgi:ATP-dependent exoDNAse (exonuclease V) beta subunit